jgi:threonine/homoserine/homoserine lactone efflux protein
MIATETVFLFVPAALALILAPGPDTVYVLTRSLGAGRRVGLRSAAGVSVGVLIHTAAVVLGLSVLLRRSALAFRLIKYVGAAYLVYLGVRALRSPKRYELGDVTTREPTDEVGESGETNEDGNDTRYDGGGHDGGGHDGSSHEGSGFARGVLVNVLNPKVALFFLAFLPQFVPATAANASLALAVLGGLYAALTCCYLSSVALVSGTIRTALRSYSRIEDGLRYGTGSVLIGLGLALVLDGDFSA